MWKFNRYYELHIVQNCCFFISIERWYAEGIVSSGYECARPDAYGLYTRITTDKEWVVETILKSGSMKPQVL